MSGAEPGSITDVDTLHKVLIEGTEMLKYGRRGKPKFKNVSVTRQGEFVWCPISTPSADARQKGNHVLLTDVSSVVRGKHTSVFSRSVAKHAADTKCFSLITGKRTVDLETSSTAMRDLWVEALTSASLRIRQGLPLLQQDGADEKHGALMPPGQPGRQPSVSESGMAPDESDQSVSDMSFSPSAVPEMTEAELDMVDFLDEGQKVVKHSRKGQPKIKWVNVAKGKLFWATPGKQKPSDIETSPFIRLVKVKNIIPGKNTTVFQRKTADRADDSLCFSVVVEDRTLDIQCQDEDTRDKWIGGLVFAVKKAKEIRNRKWLNKKRYDQSAKGGVGLNRTVTVDDVQIQEKMAAHNEAKQRRDGAVARSMTWSQLQQQDGDDHKHEGEASDGDANSTSRGAPGSGGSPGVGSALTEFEKIKADLKAQADKSKLGADHLRMLMMLDKGTEMTKFGRKGNPKKKYVNVTQGKVFWAPAQFGRTDADSPVTTFVQLVDVTGVLSGKITKVFGRKVARAAPVTNCFSIVTKRRTLDLEAPSEVVRDQWVEALQFAVKRTKDEVHRQWLAKQRLHQYASNTLNASDVTKWQSGRIAYDGKDGSSDSLHADEKTFGMSSPLKRSNTWSGRDEQVLTATRLVAGLISGHANLGRSGSSSLLAQMAGTPTKGGRRLGKKPDDAEYHDMLEEMRRSNVVHPNPAKQRNQRKTVTGLFDELHKKGDDDGAAAAREKKQMHRVPPPIREEAAADEKEGLGGGRGGVAERKQQQQEQQRADDGRPPTQADLRAAERRREEAELAALRRGAEQEAKEEARLADKRHRQEAGEDVEDDDELELAEAEAEAEAAALAEAEKARRQHEEWDRQRRASIKSKMLAAAAEVRETGTVAATTNAGHDDDDDEEEGGGSTAVEEDDDDEEEMTDTDPGPPPMPPTASDWEDTEAEFTEVPEHTEAEDTLATSDVSSSDDTSSDEDSDLGEVYEEKVHASPAAALPSLSEQEAEKLLDTLDRACEHLTSIQANWSQRAGAMTHIQEAIHKKNLPSVTGWWEEMRILRGCVATQLDDLRSSIVRAACSLLVEMSLLLGHRPEFVDTLKFILPVLFKRLYVTIKVISTSCDNCVEDMLTRARFHAPALIPTIIHTALNDCHATVRAFTAKYLTQVLIECADDSAVDEYILELAGCIGRLIGDSDKEVRLSSRNMFLAFERLWPQAAQKLLEKFSALTQRTIHNERRAFKKLVKTVIARQEHIQFE